MRMRAIGATALVVAVAALGIRVVAGRDTPTPSGQDHASAAASPSATMSRNPLPIAVPVAQDGSITFSNIAAKISKVPRVAYASVQAVEAANTPVSIPTQVLVGPHTTPNVADPQAAFARVMTLWAGFRQPSSYYALLFSFRDKQWALDAGATLPPVVDTGGIQGGSGLAGRINQCTAVHQCSGANSGIVDGAKNYGLGQFGMDPQHNGKDPYFQLGGIEGHEYTHAVQGAQFIDDASNRSANQAVQTSVPCWFIEGQANFAGTAVEAGTYAKYMRWRKNMPKGWPIPSFTDYSAESIRNVLLTSKPPECLPPSPIYDLGYGVGALVIEALTAIGGPQSTMAVLTEIGYGLTYEEAFQAVYGISWESAAPIMAQVAAAEYAATR